MPATSGPGSREPPAHPRPGRALRARARDRKPGGRLTRAGLRAAEADGSGDRFGLLLLVLITTYVLSAFVTGAWVSAVQIVLFVVVAALATRTGRIRRQTARAVIAVLAAGSAAAVTLALTPFDVDAGLASLWTALVLLFTVVVILRRVLTHPVITKQSIFGAVAAYMIIGLLFAAIYAAMNRFGGGGFFSSGSAANAKTFQYFSFTTLTTLGYGDFTAAGSGGQAVAVMEALLGQVFLATLVARLVASFRPRTGQDRAAAAARRRGPRASGLRGPARRRAGGTVRRRAGSATGTASRARARPARR